MKFFKAAASMRFIGVMTVITFAIALAGRSPLAAADDGKTGDSSDATITSIKARVSQASALRLRIIEKMKMIQANGPKGLVEFVEKPVGVNSQNSYSVGTFRSTETTNSGSYSESKIRHKGWFWDSEVTTSSNSQSSTKTKREGHSESKQVVVRNLTVPADRLSITGSVYDADELTTLQAQLLAEQSALKAEVKKYTEIQELISEISILFFNQDYSMSGASSEADIARFVTTAKGKVDILESEKNTLEQNTSRWGSADRLTAIQKLQSRITKWNTLLTQAADKMDALRALRLVHQSTSTELQLSNYTQANAAKNKINQIDSSLGKLERYLKNGVTRAEADLTLAQVKDLEQDLSAYQNLMVSLELDVAHVDNVPLASSITYFALWGNNSGFSIYLTRPHLADLAIESALYPNQDLREVETLHEGKRALDLKGAICAIGMMTL